MDASSSQLPSSSSTVKIRPSTLSDFDGVRSVLRNSFPSQLHGHYPQDELVRMLPLLTRPSPQLLSCGTFYVAEQDSKIVGCGGWTSKYMISSKSGLGNDEEGLAHLRHFATHEDWLRRSIGKSIFIRCLVECRIKGMKKMMVFAVLNAVPFYTNCGFEVKKYMDMPLGNMKLNVAIMVRNNLDDLDGGAL